MQVLYYYQHQRNNIFHFPKRLPKSKTVNCYKGVYIYT